MGMTWNYRIVAYTVEGVGLFGITEVHYDDNDPIWYVRPTDIQHLVNVFDHSELRDEWKAMQQAFKLPILDLDNWPNEYNKIQVAS